MVRFGGSATERSNRLDKEGPLDVVCLSFIGPPSSSLALHLRI